MKNLLINKNTYFLLVLSSISIVLMFQLVGDSKSNLYISNGKMYSDNMFSREINSDGIAAEMVNKPALTPKPFSQIKYRKQEYFAKENSSGKSKSANSVILKHTFSVLTQELQTADNENFPSHTKTPDTKTSSSLTAESMASHQNSPNIYESNTSIKNRFQKTKPNGPGMEGTLPIGDGVWLLLLFVIGYSFKKVFLK